VIGGGMKLRILFVTSVVATVLCTLGAVSPSATAKAKKTPKRPKATKVAARPTPANPAAAPSGLRNFSCTGSAASRLTEYTYTGTIDSDIVMTNVSVTKNYVEQDGAAVSQPTVVMTAANPKLTTARDSFEKFVVYQLNRIPPLATAADIGKYAYDYRINFPDTISTDPDFWSVMIVEGYLAKEGTLTNDPQWDTTRAVLVDATCKFV
jgi:hypothetical protein